jgi:MFS family permease
MVKAKMPVRDKITLGLMVLMFVFLQADTNVMTAILKELKAEYGVSEITLGFIGSLFTILGAIIGIIFGYFADKASRKWLLVAVVLVGEIPCILTGVPALTQNIEMFAFWRVLSGIGLGGIFPLTFSLLSDYFHEDHRAVASAWLGVAWAIGILFGMMAAGFLTPMNLFGLGWRVPFIVVAVPNIPLAIIFAIYAKDPERGRTESALEKLIEEGVVYKQKIKLSDFKYVFSNKTNIWSFMQGLPGTVPWGILSFWIIYFFEEVRNVSKEKATFIIMMLGVGATIGGLVAGYIGEWLYNKNPKYMPAFCGVCVILGAIPAFMLVNVPIDPHGWGYNLYIVLAVVTGFFVSAAGPNVRAMLMNVNRPENRGTVFACFNITDNIGKGFGPAIGGLMLPVFVGMGVNGYIGMMNFAVFWWIPCGLIFFMIMRYIAKDRDALRQLMNQRAEEMKKGI